MKTQKHICGKKYSWSIYRQSLSYRIYREVSKLSGRKQPNKTNKIYKHILYQEFIFMTNKLEEKRDTQVRPTVHSLWCVLLNKLCWFGYGLRESPKVPVLEAWSPGRQCGALTRWATARSLSHWWGPREGINAGWLSSQESRGLQEGEAGRSSIPGFLSCQDHFLMHRLPHGSICPGLLIKATLTGAPRSWIPASKTMSGINLFLCYPASAMENWVKCIIAKV